MSRQLARPTLVYDDRKQVTELVLPNGGRTKYEWDELGRVVKTKNAREGTARFQYDAEGRLLESYSMVETLQQHAYDPEGNLLEARDPNRHVKLGYEHFHRVAWREEDGTRLRFEYDTEDRVTAVVNEAGERYTFELDPAGRVVKETGFDGRAREYVRDIAGRPTLTVLPSGRTTSSTYDVMNRLLEAKHSDKTFAKFEYAVDGLLTRAENEASVVEMERDSLGRVVREVVNGRAVDSQYDASGNRTEMTSSLGARLVMRRDGLRQPREIREVERPDGVRVAFEYDPFARRTAKRTLSAAGTVDQEVQFVWDGHNVIHELDSERGLISWQREPESFTPLGRRWTIASDHLGTPTEMYDEVGRLAWKMQLDVFGAANCDALLESFARSNNVTISCRWSGNVQVYQPDGRVYRTGNPLRGCG